MIEWLEKNKRFIIGFLATITTTCLVFIYQKIALYKYKSSIQSFVDKQEADNFFLFLVTMDILVKITIGISAIYFMLVILKIVFSVLKNKYQKVGKA